MKYVGVNPQLMLVQFFVMTSPFITQSKIHQQWSSDILTEVAEEQLLHCNNSLAQNFGTELAKKAKQELANYLVEKCDYASYKLVEIHTEQSPLTTNRCQRDRKLRGPNQQPGGAQKNETTKEGSASSRQALTVEAGSKAKHSMYKPAIIYQDFSSRSHPTSNEKSK